MIRSMSTAVTGLRGHQQKLDVIGNNIANVNTVAFKKSQARFEDLLSQTIQGATAPLTRGGINPSQVGMGMRVSAIVDIHFQGAITSTDRETDLAIEGDGFFIVSDGSREYYTRDGSFGRDAAGELVNANGLKLMGWRDEGEELEPMHIPLGESMVARPSQNLGFTGNLDALGGWDTAVSKGVGDSVDIASGDFMTGAATSVFGYTLTYAAHTAAAGTSAVSDFSIAANQLNISYDALDAAAANLTVVNFVGGAAGAAGAVWSEALGIHTLTVTMEAGVSYDVDALEDLIRNATEEDPGDRPVEADANYNVTVAAGTDVFSLANVGDTAGVTLAAGVSASWAASDPPDGTYTYDGLNSTFGTVEYEGTVANLDELTGAAGGDVVTIAATPSPEAEYTYEYYIYDSLGRRYSVDYTFVPQGNNTWDYDLEVRDTNGNLQPFTPLGTDPAGAPNGSLVFTSLGALDTANSTIPAIRFSPPGAAQLNITPDFARTTQLAGTNSLLVREQDGYAAGELVAFYISRTGSIIGTYTNGMVEELGQIGMAFFSNPEGLIKEGGNLYMETANSGEVRIGLPGTEGRGLISSSALEMSNTDLAFEFTELITTSRAFQANTRVVTTSDEVLVEVINMKR
jgi:flagellar hook protein FlgE